MLKKQQLIDIAKLECEKESWPWLEPISIQDNWSDWTIITNSDKIGCNVRIIVSKKSGEVFKKSFMPR
jgi:hypothetical protein